MSLNLRALQIKLEKPPYAPFFCIYYKDLYLYDEALKSIKNIFSADQFEITQSSLGDDTFDELYTQICSPQLFAPKRLFILKNCESLKAPELEKIITLEAVLPHHTYVVYVFAGTADKRKKFFKFAKDKTQLVELPAPYPNKVAPWVSYMCQKQDLNLTREAQNQLALQSNFELIEIHKNLFKISLLFENSKEISSKDLQSCLNLNQNVSIFDYAKALGLKKWIFCLSHLNTLTQNGESLVALAAICSRQLLIIKKCVLGKNNKLDKKNILSHLGVSPYFADDYFKSAELWNLKDIDLVIEEFAGLDLKLKSVNIDKKLLFEASLIKVSTL